MIILLSSAPSKSYTKIQFPPRKEHSCRYRVQTVNGIRGNNLCLLCESYETHKHAVWAQDRVP